MSSRVPFPLLLTAVLSFAACASAPQPENGSWRSASAAAPSARAEPASSQTGLPTTAPTEHGPPAGVGPCHAAKDATARQASLRCFEERVKPSLLAIARDGRSEHYRFGSADYMEIMLGLTPNVTQEAVTLTGAQAGSRYWQGMQRHLLAQITALGSVARLSEEEPYEIVTLQLRDDGTPVDGDLQLVFLVGVVTGDIPLVFRLLGG